MNCFITEIKHKNCVFYGIRCELEGKSICFDDMSGDESAVRQLRCDLHGSDVTETTLYDIVDDFMNK